MNSSWPIVPLGNILTERREIPSFEAIFNGEIPIVSKISFDTGQIRLREDGKTKTDMILIQPGDLLVSGINAAKGAIAIYDKENNRPIAATIHYGAYLPDKNKVDVCYLWLFLRSRNFQEILAEKVPGGIKTELKAKRFLPIPIPLPPLPEQERVVAKIDELVAKIEEAKKLRIKSTLESKAVFESAMNNVWSETGNWQSDLIGNLISLASGQVNPMVEPYSKLPHINGESIESGTGRLLQNYHSSEEDGITSGKYYFKAYSVLYSKIRPYLRKSAIVPFEGVCSADIYAFDRIDSKIEPAFFKYSLISPPFTAYANNLSGRTRMPKLNQKQLFAYKMFFPNRGEQQQIVKYLDDLQSKIDSLKNLHAETEKELNTLLPSILDKAFKGEL